MSRPTIEIDADICEGFGTCYALAPEAVEEAADGRGRVVGSPEPAVAAELVDNCPRGAIRRVGQLG